MAKSDNLKDFLVDVADAIREKEGTTELINPQEFSERIRAISGGGGVEPVLSNDVNFRDYDGTILHSFSKDEFLALSALPELPKQKGLICQGWNWSLGDAKEQVEYSGELEIGANYITDDGKTRLYITVPESRKRITLYYYTMVGNHMVLNWGDGNEDEQGSSTGAISFVHEYQKAGDYVITLHSKTNKSFYFGNRSLNYSVLGNTSENTRVYPNMLKKLEIGANVASLGYGGLQYCMSLRSISIPVSVTTYDVNSLRYCFALKYLVIPQGVKQLGNYSLANCYALNGVSLPYSLTTFVSYCLYQCFTLNQLTLPKYVTSINASTFGYCYGLSRFKVPAGITAIETDTFYRCTGVACYDFTDHSAIPSLATTFTLSVVADCKVVVPDQLYDEWIAATNWSAYASNIIKASEYTD